MKLNKIVNIIFVILQKFIIIFEFTSLKLRYKDVKVFKKGKGGLNKYIINDNTFLKKYQGLVEVKIFFYNMLSEEKEEYIHIKLKYLKNIIKFPHFSKVNLCYKVTNRGIFLKYIHNASKITLDNYSIINMLNIIKAIQELHQNGYYYYDLSVNNIIIYNKNYYLIDIESITPIRTEDDKEYDYYFLLKSIKDNQLKDKVKCLLLERKLIRELK